MTSGEGVRAEDMLCRAGGATGRPLRPCSTATGAGWAHGTLRLDRRLAGRVDTSDVLQEAYLEADKRFAEHLREPTMPFFLWCGW